MSLDLLDAGKLRISSFGIHHIFKYSYSQERSSFSFTFLDQEGFQSDYRFISVHAYDIFQTLGHIISIIIRLNQQSLDSKSSAAAAADLHNQVLDTPSGPLFPALSSSQSIPQPISQMRLQSFQHQPQITPATPPQPQPIASRRLHPNLATLKQMLSTRLSTQAVVAPTSSDRVSLDSPQKDGSFFLFLSGISGFGSPAAAGNGTSESSNRSPYRQYIDKDQPQRSRNWFVRRAKSTSNFGVPDKVATAPHSKKLSSISTSNLADHRDIYSISCTHPTAIHQVEPLSAANSISFSASSLVAVPPSPLLTPESDSRSSSSPPSTRPHALDPSGDVSCRTQKPSQGSPISRRSSDMRAAMLSNVQVVGSPSHLPGMYLSPQSPSRLKKNTTQETNVQNQRARRAHTIQPLPGSQTNSSENLLQSMDDPLRPLRVLDENNKEILLRATINGEIQPVAGTVKALVDCLYTEPLSAYADVFLLTFRLFTTPAEILQLLIIQYSNLQKSPSDIVLPITTSTQLPVVLMHRIFSFVKKWVTQYRYDFADPLVERILGTFLEIVEAANNKAYVNSLLAIINSDCSTNLYPLPSLASTLERQSICESMDLAELQDVIKSQFDVLHSSAKDIARSLTLRDWTMFKAIHLSEFVHFIAPDSYFDTQNDTKEARTINLTAFIQRFNQIGFWVATTVCSYSDLKQRTRALSKLIRVAQHCFSFGNFNTCMAIFSGLNTSPVLRLKRTFEGLSLRVSALYAELERCFDFQNNYKAYRDIEDKSHFATIPFLGLIIKDLSGMKEVYAKRLPNGLINFEKHWELFRRLLCVTSNQSWPYIIEPTPDESVVSAKDDIHAFEDSEPMPFSEATGYQGLLMPLQDQKSGDLRPCSFSSMSRMHAHVLPYLSQEQLTLISRELEPTEEADAPVVEESRLESRGSGFFASLFETLTHSSTLTRRRRSSICSSDSDSDAGLYMRTGSGSRNSSSQSTLLSHPSPPLMGSLSSSGTSAITLPQRLRLMRRPISLANLKFNAGALPISNAKGGGGSGGASPLPLYSQSPSVSPPSNMYSLSSSQILSSSVSSGSISLETSSTPQQCISPLLGREPSAMQLFTDAASDVAMPPLWSSSSSTPPLCPSPPASLPSLSAGVFVPQTLFSRSSLTSSASCSSESPLRRTLTGTPSLSLPIVQLPTTLILPMTQPTLMEQSNLSISSSLDSYIDFSEALDKPEQEAISPATVDHWDTVATLPNDNESEVLPVPITPVMMEAQATVVSVEFGDPRLWPQRRLSQPVIILTEGQAAELELK
ncbi:hypothetical protein BASA81_017726 [Batrachochytrium salamandrivorans]|nr:hypothetical protein BASA81_017726 [Batrachochytrium salamandrivorans]